MERLLIELGRAMIDQFGEERLLRALGRVMVYQFGEESFLIELW